MAHVDLTLASKARSTDIAVAVQGYVNLVASLPVTIHFPGNGGDSEVYTTSKAYESVNFLPGDSFFLIAGPEGSNVRYTLPA